MNVWTTVSGVTAWSGEPFDASVASVSRCSDAARSRLTIRSRPGTLGAARTLVALRGELERPSGGVTEGGGGDELRTKHMADAPLNTSASGLRASCPRPTAPCSVFSQSKHTQSAAQNWPASKHSQ